MLITAMCNMIGVILYLTQEILITVVEIVYQFSRIKINVIQIDFQKIKSPYKTMTAMNRWFGKNKYS